MVQPTDHSAYTAEKVFFAGAVSFYYGKDAAASVCICDEPEFFFPFCLISNGHSVIMVVMMTMSHIQIITHPEDFKGRIMFNLEFNDVYNNYSLAGRTSDTRNCIH